MKDKEFILAKKSECILFAFLGMVLFVIHIWNIKDFFLLYVLDDELGYWGIAATFAGYDWGSTMNYVRHYGYGYSLILAPLFWIFDNPVNMYQAAIFLNAIFIVLTFCFLYKIIGWFFSSLKKTIQMLIAFCACTYSAYVVQSSIAWSETWLLLIFSIITFSLLKVLEVPTERKSFTFGILIIYIFAVHQRTIGIVIAAGLVLIIATIRKKITKKQLVFFVGGVLVALTAHILIDNHLKSVISNSEFLAINTFSGQITKITSLFSFEGLYKFVQILLGQTFYLGVASFLLIYWGYGYIVQNTYRCLRNVNINKNATTRDYGLVFLGIAAAFTVGISALFMINASRIDHVVYGRYNEIFAGVFIALGFGSILSSEIKILPMAISSALLVSTAGLFTFFAVKTRETYNSICAVGTWRYFNDKPMIPLAVLISIVTFAGMFLFFVWDRKRQRPFVTAICICICAAIFVSIGENVVQKAIITAQANNIKIADMVSELDEKQIPVFYEITSQKGLRWHKGIVQFLMGKRPLLCETKQEIEHFSGEKYIVSPVKDPFAYKSLLEFPKDYNGELMLFHIGGNGKNMNTINVNLDGFSSQNSTKQIEMQSNGTAGFFAYGKYYTLSRSNYIFSAELKLVGEAPDAIGNADIFDGINQIYRTEIDKSDFSPQGDFSLKMPMSISRTTSNIEFRIYLNEGVIMELTGATLEKSEYSGVKILPFNVEHIQNGTLENGEVKSNGQAGTLVYGPGNLLFSGFYQAEVDMSLPTDAALQGQIGTLDIADAGQVITSRPIIAEDFQNGELTTTLPLVTGKNVETLEVRIHVNDAVPLCVKERRIKGEESLSVDLSDMKSNVGSFDGEKIVSNGAEGYLAWGNYMPMEPGNYKVRVQLDTQIPMEESDKIIVDVTCKQGVRILNVVELEKDDFVDGEAVVDLPVEIKESVEDFEVRVFKSANCQIAVTDAEIAFDAGQGENK